MTILKLNKEKIINFTLKRLIPFIGGLSMCVAFFGLVIFIIASSFGYLNSNFTQIIYNITLLAIFYSLLCIFITKVFDRK